MREVISTERPRRPPAPYSQAIRAGELVFTAGQLGIDPATGELAADDVQARPTGRSRTCERSSRRPAAGSIGS